MSAINGTTLIDSVTTICRDCLKYYAGNKGRSK